jgi:hypothetical protein
MKRTAALTALRLAAGLHLYMPDQFTTFRFEVDHRESNGRTSPDRAA